MKTRWLSNIAIAMSIGWASTAGAGVVINAAKGTSDRAGHSLWTLTAISDNPNEPILGFDFSGDPDNNDPATGLGFFGPLSQVKPVTVATVFQDNNIFFQIVGRNVNEDSQFLFRSDQVVASASSLQEGPNILQATFAFADPKGFALPFVQLVIPDAATATVSYRGDVLVGQSGAGISKRVEGGLNIVIGDPIPPNVPNISESIDSIGEVIDLKLVDVAPGTPPLTWSELSGPLYTPGFGAMSGAPGLGVATWSWNAATQEFQFRLLGATAGRYVWNGRATDIYGWWDDFSITVDVKVPEPASLALVGLAGLLFHGIRVRRPSSSRSTDR